jgi:uncharacterized protein (DUF169 family)
MTDFADVEKNLTTALGLSRRPVAIAFREAPPAEVARLAGTQPSGCSFWRLAAAGQVFYTVPSDHYNCPVGSYTHNIPLPADREPELMNTLWLMMNVRYLRMDEIPGIPRLAQTPAVTIYAPLAQTPVEPNAVLVAGTPARLMLLHEAATRAAVGAASLLGRPTCMAIPAALASGMASTLGCVGSRIYTGIADEEFHSVIRTKDLAPVMAELDTITSANAALTEYHTGRLASLATASFHMSHVTSRE